MAYKKYREMKVYEARGYQYKQTPSIVLKGKWLSELGFNIGEQIEVKCEDGRLIITKANEIFDTGAEGIPRLYCEELLEYPAGCA